MSAEKPSAEVPKFRCSPAEAQRINDALDADCIHGLTVVKRDGDDMPIKAWDCYGCTASIVSGLIATALSDARREAFEEAAGLVCYDCRVGDPATTCESPAHHDCAYVHRAPGYCRDCQAWPIRRRMDEGERA